MFAMYKLYSGQTVLQKYLDSYVAKDGSVKECACIKRNHSLKKGHKRVFNTIKTIYHDWLVCLFFQPPRVGGIKVYTTTVRRDEVYMDLEIKQVWHKY